MGEESKPHFKAVRGSGGGEMDGELKRKWGRNVVQEGRNLLQTFDKK